MPEAACGVCTLFAILHAPCRRVANHATHFSHSMIDDYKPTLPHSSTCSAATATTHMKHSGRFARAIFPPALARLATDPHANHTVPSRHGYRPAVAMHLLGTLTRDVREYSVSLQYAVPAFRRPSCVPSRYIGSDEPTNQHRTNRASYPAPAPRTLLGCFVAAFHRLSTHTTAISEGAGWCAAAVETRFNTNATV
jgi:hypothetical protein